MVGVMNTYVRVTVAIARIHKAWLSSSGSTTHYHIVRRMLSVSTDLTQILIAPLADLIITRIGVYIIQTTYITTSLHIVILA